MTENIPEVDKNITEVYESIPEVNEIPRPTEKTTYYLYRKDSKGNIENNLRGMYTSRHSFYYNIFNTSQKDVIVMVCVSGRESGIKYRPKEIPNVAQPKFLERMKEEDSLVGKV